MRREGEAYRNQRHLDSLKHADLSRDASEWGPVKGLSRLGRDFPPDRPGAFMEAID
ncbi:hypothetical protein [Terribacillus halophilus]|uniref:hypothetical protein n=1 Tax=Terribacillus halophilus TaxID=361279 RepID=UPI0039820AF8